MLLAGGEFGPVYLHTQPFLFQKHLQYKLINNNIMIAIIGVPMVESNLISMDDQKVGGNDLILVKVLFMLNTAMCFTLGILLTRLFRLSLVRLDMSMDCIKLKLLVLE